MDWKKVIRDCVGKGDQMGTRKNRSGASSTFDFSMFEKDLWTYRMDISPREIDTWGKKRKALLILGLIFCQQSIELGDINREFLEEQNVEPEMVDAVFTMLEVMFGKEARV